MGMELNEQQWLMVEGLLKAVSVTLREDAWGHLVCLYGRDEKETVEQQVARLKKYLAGTDNSYRLCYLPLHDGGECKKVTANELSTNKILQGHFGVTPLGILLDFALSFLRDQDEAKTWRVTWLKISNPLTASIRWDYTGYDMRELKTLRIKQGLWLEK